jgi:hypothetical protein
MSGKDSNGKESSQRIHIALIVAMGSLKENKYV